MSTVYQPSDRETEDIPIAARRLGINRQTAYELARHDRLPVPTIRVGRRLFVSRRALDELLGSEREAVFDAAS